MWSNFVAFVAVVALVAFVSLVTDAAGEFAPPHPAGAINRAPTDGASLRSPAWNP